MCLCARKPKVTCAPIDILQWFVISIRNASFKVKLKYRVLFYFRGEHLFNAIKHLKTDFKNT